MWFQKGSVLASSFGVAAALILVLFLDAVFLGESSKIVNYIRYTKPDIWVMQKGVKNMHMASSYLSDWKADDVAAVEGVRSVSAILYMNSMVNVGNRESFAYVVGLNQDDSRAGPWSVVQGKSSPGNGEILIPQVYIDIFKLGMGDKVSIADSTFIITGLTEGTFSMANSIVFITMEDLEKILETAGTYSYLLVDADVGQNIDRLAKKIETEVESVAALTQKRFMNNDFQMAMRMGVELVSFMSIIGTALATMIIAFNAFTMVSRNKREFCISKALGYSNSAVYAAVILQTSIVTLLGIGLAITISYAALPVIHSNIPQIHLMISLKMIMHITVLALFSGLVAALIPTFMVVKADPMSAFKE